MSEFSALGFRFAKRSSWLTLLVSFFLDMLHDMDVPLG